MSVALSPSPVQDALPRQAVRALTALVIGGAAAILDSTVVTIALGPLSRQFHAPTTTVQWVITGYLLAIAVTVPLSGWAQSRFGGKHAWITALSVFVVGSAACAGAWSMTSLIAFRALQGIGAGLMMPLMQTLAMQAVSGAGPKVMSKAVMVITVPLALGPILGPVLGGVILNGLSWRWIFLINVPLVAVGIILARRWLQHDQTGSRSDRKPLDIVGLSLIAPALTGILLGLTNVESDGGFGDADVLIPLSVGVALLFAFVGWALRRHSGALIDVSLLRVRSLGAASLVLFAAGAALYAGLVLLPLYWQQVRGADVLSAALMLIPQGVGALVARLAAGALAPRVGVRATTIGAFALTAAATIPFALATASTSAWWLGAVLFVRGLGVGAIIMAPMMAAYVDISSEQMPHASMMTRITQQVGASFGAAVIAVVLQALVSSGLTVGFQGAFWWATAIAAAAVVPVFAFPRENLGGTGDSKE